MSNNYLDTRDLAKRLDELEDLEQDRDEARYALDRTFVYDFKISGEDLEEIKRDLFDAEANFGTEEAEELDELRDIQSEVSEFRNGETMIPTHLFKEYVQDMLEDCGVIPKDLPWYVEIDWDATAEHIKADYAEVVYQGTEYYVRA